MSVDRPLRADARRNRDQILAAAAGEVADLAARVGAGESARLSLDSVAARAGVGIGTLYRHFPSRAALIEAIYLEELTGLCTAPPAMLASADPGTALRAWMSRYLDFVDSKRAMGEDFRELVATGAMTRTGTRTRLTEAVGLFLAAGVVDGSLRADVEPDDVVAAMAGAAFTAIGAIPREQAERLCSLLVDGLYAAGTSSPPGRRSSGRPA